MAWAWRSWCAAKRPGTRARAASRRSMARAGAGCQGRPRVGPLITQNNGPTGMVRRMVSQRSLLEAPVVHANLATAAAFAAPDQYGPAAAVEIELVEDRAS